MTLLKWCLIASKQNYLIQVLKSLFTIEAIFRLTLAVVDSNVNLNNQAGTYMSMHDHFVTI